MNQTLYLRSTVRGNSVQLAPPTSLLAFLGRLPLARKVAEGRQYSHARNLDCHIPLECSKQALLTAHCSLLFFLSHTLSSTLFYPLHCSTILHPTASASRQSFEISTSTTRYAFSHLPSYSPLSPLFPLSPPYSHVIHFPPARAFFTTYFLYEPAQQLHKFFPYTCPLSSSHLLHSSLSIILQQMSSPPPNITKRRRTKTNRHSTSKPSTPSMPHATADMGEPSINGDMPSSQFLSVSLPYPLSPMMFPPKFFD